MGSAFRSAKAKQLERTGIQYSIDEVMTALVERDELIKRGGKYYSTGKTKDLVSGIFCKLKEP